MEERQNIGDASPSLASASQQSQDSHYVRRSGASDKVISSSSSGPFFIGSAKTSGKKAGKVARARVSMACVHCRARYVTYMLSPMY